MTRNSGKDNGPRIKVTQTALDIALQARDQEIGSESHDLWMELAGSSNGKREFSMYFRPAGEARSDDFIQPHDGIAIVVPALSADRLTGGPTVFITSAQIEKGLGLTDDEDDFEELNVLPSSPAIPAASGLAADLSGSVAQRVVQTLNQQINPSIAAHGGRGGSRSRRRRYVLPAAVGRMPGLRSGHGNPLAGNRSCHKERRARDSTRRGRDRPRFRPKPLLRAFQEIAAHP